MKDQLLAESFDIDLAGLGDRQLKKDVKSMVKLQLIEKGVLVAKQEEPGQ